jgi:Tfp pilus assembly pilus retraction ATPase PilT
LKDTLGIALEYTLDMGHLVLATLEHTYCVEKLRRVGNTLNMGHLVLATLEHTYCVEKLRRVGIYA